MMITKTMLFLSDEKYVQSVQINSKIINYFIETKRISRWKIEFF